MRTVGADSTIDDWDVYFMLFSLSDMSQYVYVTGACGLVRWICACSCTHQDGQHNVLEVIPQVGSVGAEEDEVALYQLRGDQRLNVQIFTRHACLLSTVAGHSARRSERQTKWLEKLLTPVVQRFIPQMTTDTSSEIGGGGGGYTETDLMQI